MNERRNSYPILLPAGKRWKALFLFIGFSGISTLVIVLVGGGKAWEKWDLMQSQLTSMQGQYAAQLRTNAQFRGRIAELTTAINEVRVRDGLQPIEHQAILDGEPVAYVLPRRLAIVRNESEKDRP